MPRNRGVHAQVSRRSVGFHWVKRIVGALGSLLTLACAAQTQAPAALAPTKPEVVTKFVHKTEVELLPCDAPTKEAITTAGEDFMFLRPSSFANLRGWNADKHHLAFSAFLRSCEKIVQREDAEAMGSGPYSGTVADWRPTCEAALALEIESRGRKKARSFFEEQFRVYAATGSKNADGKITGYYVQPLRGSKTRGGRYQFPLYKRPEDLRSVELDKFVADGRSRRAWGRVDEDSGSFVPYPERADFLQENPGDKAVLFWLDNPADVVRVEIEGSGLVVLPSGKKVHIGFDGKNGRPSGRTREVARSLKKIATKNAGKPWSKEELDHVEQIMAAKTSMVFFSREGRKGAIGTQNVVLTPRRSLAVDRAVIALSTPVWLETQAPRSPEAPAEAWHRLLIAQDTGGGITGSMRGDIYWGDDATAVAIGRRVNTRGRMYLLLPKDFSPPVVE